jgi:hypothetical protein
MFLVPQGGQAGKDFSEALGQGKFPAVDFAEAVFGLDEDCVWG